jgi:chromosomal replication initiation ATPase DnaA
MKVPSIEDIMKNAEVDILEKKSRLSRLASEGDFDPYAVAQLRREIKSQEETLNACRARVREEKIEKLGL